MKTQLMLLFYLLMLTPFAFTQEYQYEVTTLIPQDAHIIDDGLTIDESGVIYGSYWGIWQGTPGTHILRYYPNGSYDTLATGLLRPNGLSYFNGKILAANSGNGQLFSIDTDGSKEVIAQISGGISHAVPVPGTDSLVITGWSQSRLYGMNALGDVTPMPTSTLFNGGVGAAFDLQGRLYIGNFNDGKILKLENGELEVFAELGGGIGFITYSDNAILATNHIDKKVYRLPVDGSEIEVIAGSGEAIMQDGIGEEASFVSPNGIVSTPSGDTIYVSEFESKSLRMIIRTAVTADEENTGAISSAGAIVYPLPSSGHISIENVDLSKIKQGIVRDSNGRVIRKLASSSFQNDVINLSDLPNGHYTLSLFDQNDLPIANLSFNIMK
ncbi:MAG: hypothetical protein MI974_14945 [Chitinophagales bacterium]|nr:hypothetical protein [Chitinophagales bacterium]